MTRANADAAPHFFVAPDLAGAKSGGTLYNRALIEALQAEGFPAEALHLDSGERALIESRRGVYWVDTLYLEHFERLAQRNAERRPLGLLLHYLPALIAHGSDISMAQLSDAEAFSLRHADAFLAPSAFMRSTLSGLGVHERMLRVLEPGRWSPGVVARTSRISLRAVLVAQLVPGKGIEPLLHALSRESIAAFELDIIGGTSADAEYAARCHALVAMTPALSRAVRFVGEVPVTDVIERIGAADLVLSASRMESYGMVLAEARTLGVPILALPGGNVSALVTPTAGGELVEDVAALARRALELALQPEELRRLRDRAKQNALPRRTWSAVAAEFREFASDLERRFAGHLT